MNKFKAGDRVRYYASKRDGWKSGVVIEYETHSSTLVQVQEDGASWWYIEEDQLYPDDGSELPVIAPKGFVHVGWLCEIVWNDGPSRSYYHGVDNKPKSWKESKNAIVLQPIVVSERISPVFIPVESK